MRFARVISCLTALSLSLLGLAAQDSLSVREWKKARGFDAGNMVESKRARAVHRSEFVRGKFRDNLSISAVAASQTPRSADYGFLYSAGLAVQKWFTPSVGVRVDALGGYMYGNRDGVLIPELLTSASVLFNLSSYIGGYDRGRFCEISTVLGAGYACEWNDEARHFFAGNVGLNVGMRIDPRVSVTLEPSLPLRVGGSGFSYGFATALGLSCDLSRSTSQASCAGKYFVSISGGLQVQNSALVKQSGTGDALGCAVSVGAGRRFADFFALRASAAYSRHVWAVYYGGYKMPSQYYSLRLEGVLDVVRLAMHKSYDGRFSGGVVLGPEFGYMVKKDIGYTLKRQYVGLSLGLHGNCSLGERFALFVEPRFTLVPYTAPNDESTSFNINRNYYDSLFNFVVGIEINL